MLAASSKILNAGDHDEKSTFVSTGKHKSTEFIFRTGFQNQPQATTATSFLLVSGATASSGQTSSSPSGSFTFAQKAMVDGVSELFCKHPSFSFLVRSFISTGAREFWFTDG
jgi:hypothetical protein